MVEELSNKHAVRDLCEFLEVSRSGYFPSPLFMDTLS